MHYKNHKNSAFTLMEMVIAIAITVIVFAAILPLFRAIENSWASQEGACETIQNGRILTDQLSRCLAKASKITSVSQPSQVKGYIQFEDYNGTAFRCDVAANNYVEFGPLGSLSDLAGPVSQLQFSCFDGNDLNTQITDANHIRVVKIQTTLTNSVVGEMGHDETFLVSSYLRTGNNEQSTVSAGTAFRYDASSGQTPALAQIDASHYLCTYEGQAGRGDAVVLSVNSSNWTISKGTTFQYDNKGTQSALSKIDNTHYLCAYKGQSNRMYAVVLIVNTTNWTVSEGTPFQFDNNYTAPALAKIDASHYLCSYSGGRAVVLTVNTSNWNVTKGTIFTYGSSGESTPALAKIDSTHYLCAYCGSGDDGYAVVLTVNSGNWSISGGQSFEFDSSKGQTPTLAQIDQTHYLCAYCGNGDDGYAVVLTVNSGNWSISGGQAFEFDSSKGQTPALAQIDPAHYLCSYTGQSNHGYALVLCVNTKKWTLSCGEVFEYGTTGGRNPVLSQINSERYLCCYTKTNNEGWAVVLNPDIVLSP